MSTPKVRHLSIDDILSLVGSFDKFQWMLDGMLCIMMIPRTYMILIMYFAALKSDWRCIQNSTACPYAHNVSLPSDNTIRCQLPRDQWEFTQPKDFSIVTQFDIYCDSEWMISFSTTILFIGWGVGAILLGWVADNYGRKVILFPSLAACMGCGLVIAFSPNITFFLVLRFIIGFFLPATGVQPFILVSEFVNSKRRPLAGISLWFFFAIALCIQGLKAYYIRKWKILFIVCTVPYFFVLVFYKFVPESVRWLSLHDKTDEALEILRKIGKINKKPLPEDVSIKSVTRKQHEKSSPVDLFRSRKVAVSSLIQAYGYVVFGMAYYALAFLSAELGGSIYRNYVLVSFVEFPACLLAIYGCERFGRKKTVMVPCFVGSILCIAIAFIEKDGGGIGSTFRIILGMTSRMLITLSYDSIYTWSVELYPTSIRAEGMGLLQIASRIGAATAPFVANVFTSEKAPFILLGSLNIISSLLYLLLPETKGIVGNETQEDDGGEKEMKHITKEEL